MLLLESERTPAFALSALCESAFCWCAYFIFQLTYHVKLAWLPWSRSLVTVHADLDSQKLTDYHQYFHGTRILPLFFTAWVLQQLLVQQDMLYQLGTCAMEAELQLVCLSCVYFKYILRLPSPSQHGRSRISSFILKDHWKLLGIHYHLSWLAVQQHLPACTGRSTSSFSHEYNSEATVHGFLLAYIHTRSNTGKRTDQYLPGLHRLCKTWQCELSTVQGIVTVSGG